ncbi:MAG: hypothetical protein QXG25_07190 [Nitrososphaerota archaeon]
MRALVEELSKERGWAVEEVGGKLYLKKKRPLQLEGRDPYQTST